MPVKFKVFQEVVAHEYVGGCRYTGYIDKSIRLTLRCGHEQYRKASQGVPTKAHCSDCDRDPAAVADFYSRQTIARTERATR